MARKSPWKVRKDTKSDSYIIDFSYRDEHGTLKRYRRSAGRGIGKREAEQKARALYREMQRDPLAFVETLVDRGSRDDALPFKDVAGKYLEDKVRLDFKVSTQRTHEQMLRVHLVPHWCSAKDRE